MPMSDISDDFFALSEARDGVGEMPKELTVSQAASILGVEEQKVLHLIADHTLCCVNADENGSPLLDAACVQTQAGKTKAAFLAEVRQIISAEKVAKTADQSSLEQLFAELAVVGEVGASDVVEAAEPVGETINIRPVPIKGFDRAAITARNVQSIIASLESANSRLESVMFRAGYLESKVENLEEKLKDMPELRTKAARSIIFEKENADLKATIAKQELELIEVHQVLDRLRESWWWRTWSWVLGMKI